MSIAPETVILGEREYQIGRLDCFDAMHVARLVSPLLPAFFGQIFGRVLDLVQKSKDANGATLDDIFSEVGEVIKLCEPLLYRVASMDRESFESVVKTCLSCVERKTGKTYGRVFVNGNLMFADMDMNEILQLMIKVIDRELRPTIVGLLKSAGSSAETSPTN